MAALGGARLGHADCRSMTIGCSPARPPPALGPGCSHVSTANTCPATARFSHAWLPGSMVRVPQQIMLLPKLPTGFSIQCSQPHSTQPTIRTPIWSSLHLQALARQVISMLQVRSSFYTQHCRCKERPIVIDRASERLPGFHRSVGACCTADVAAVRGVCHVQCWRTVHLSCDCCKVATNSMYVDTAAWKCWISAIIDVVLTAAPLRADLSMLKVVSDISQEQSRHSISLRPRAWCRCTFVSWRDLQPSQWRALACVGKL